jgi:hypothetical protein
MTLSLRLITGGRPAPVVPNQVDLVARMAADLRRLGIPANEREAVRVLMALPYPWQLVARLAADALFEARQSVVSKTMAKS